MGIPKHIHFVWLGEKIPIWAADNIARWRLAHLGWDISLHRDASMLLPEYFEMFDAAGCIGDQAELLQYSILRQAPAGWMLHCDTRPKFPFCLTKLAELHPITTELLVQGGRTKYPDVWCMAATPECGAWKTINAILPGQMTGDHRIARYGAKMLRAIQHNIPETLHLAPAGGHIIHEFRDGWRGPPIKCSTKRQPKRLRGESRGRSLPAT